MNKVPHCGGNGQRSEEVVNLNKKHFLVVGSSFEVPRFVFGFSLVFYPRQIGIALGAGFWTKSTFANTHSFGGRTYPVRHYPIAIRLRTLAFGNMVAMIVDPVNIRATCASALPTHSRSSWGPHNIYSAVLCIALFPQSGDSSGAILGVRSVALLHLGSSLVSRWSLARSIYTRYKGNES